MPTVTRKWPVLVGLCLFGGCATVKSLDYPTVKVTLVDHERTEKLQQVWFSPVDFFDESKTDVKIVCTNKDWRAPVNAQGIAKLEMKTSTHVFNMLAMDSTIEKMDKMNRGFAICAERPDKTVEHLMTIESGAMMFAAGATLHVDCEYSAAKWQCSSSLTE